LALICASKIAATTSGIIAAIDHRGDPNRCDDRIVIWMATLPSIPRRQGRRPPLGSLG
jgi:hypothetical protein